MDRRAIHLGLEIEAYSMEFFFLVELTCLLQPNFNYKSPEKGDRMKSKNKQI